MKIIILIIFAQQNLIIVETNQGALKHYYIIKNLHGAA